MTNITMPLSVALCASSASAQLHALSCQPGRWVPTQSKIGLSQVEVELYAGSW